MDQMSTDIRSSIAQGESSIEEPNTATERGALLSMWPHTPEDPTSTQYMRLQETSETLAFWDDPEEDVYGPENGDPV
jgi:hypothetical protein